MAQTFFPKMHIMVAASKPHPKNTQYKVSVGEEVWEDAKHLVTKVQMVYDGKVAGRRSPSYPIGTNDHQNVIQAEQKLLELYNNTTDITIE
ncbi:hypothetical protein ACQKEX_14550 [Bacillus pumilus]|uniref:hypothetical protein n=1 Tax=Bacillaceae TaxID=186817 RepID=UPI000960D478|nr:MULTISPECIES: hypothetical protein [Bacillaceae]MBU8576450.1 hypothetical protein [Bacillus pumilus]OLP64350.1 hypothetical protein BACPU_25750 [Bacillus pumilus]